MLEQLILGNYEATGFLSCLGVQFLSLPRAALPLPQFALLHLVPRVQIGEQFSEIAVALRLPVSLVCPRSKRPKLGGGQAYDGSTD
jgi:hypothetical protein